MLAAAVLLQVVAVALWVAGWYLVLGPPAALLALSLPTFAFGFELERKR